MSENEKKKLLEIKDLILFPDSPAPSACAFSLLASAHST